MTAVAAVEADVGGCLCGAVRFSVAAEPIWSAYCHCNSCRHATGSPVAAFVGFNQESVHFRGDARRLFSSSPGVERSYCATCGSPLSYRSVRWPNEIHLYTSTFDHPIAYPPTFHVHWAEKLPWLVITDSLPKHDHASSHMDAADASLSLSDTGVPVDLQTAK